MVLKIVKETLATMSLSDKIGQMSQVELGLLVQDDPQNPGHKIVDHDKLEHYFGELGIGSLLNNVPGDRWTASQFRQVMVDIQQIARDHGRPPVIWGLDSVHGANYIHGAILTPQAINIGATFNKTVATLAGKMASRDTRAAGINWLFSPLLGISLSSSWSRVYETFGEDPKLVGDMGLAMIQGIQEQDTGGGVPAQAAACAKHFIGYSMPHNGHDRTPSWIPNRHLYQYFVPPWREALREAKTVMEAYTDFDGVPNVANFQTLEILLRERLEFNGVVVTDYQEILNLKNWHHIVDSNEGAIIYALQEGSIDMSMIPWDADEYREAIQKGINEKTLNMARIDQSVQRVLLLKQGLGMEEETLTMNDPNIAKIGSENDRKQALDMAYQSIIMVENKNKVLPMLGSKRVHVTGPTSNSLRYQSGGWTWQWQGAQADDEWFTYGYTVLEAANLIGGWTVSSSCGVDILGNDCSDVVSPEGSLVSKALDWVKGSEETASIDRTVAQAKQSDYVIVCIGEENYAEKPGDIESLSLPTGQYELVQALSVGTNAKIIVIYFGGRPRLLEPIVNHADAILLGFLPGPDAGQAVVDIVMGTINPSGRLPLTYPKYEDQGGVPYFHVVSDQCTKGDGTLPHFEYVPCEVQWPFGHGLSFTAFEYSELTLSDSQIHYTAEGQRRGISRGSEDKGITVSVMVKNAGTVDADETVMFFTFDDSRHTTPEYKRLRAYEKIHLGAGERKLVSISLSMKDPDMRYIGPHDDTHSIVQNGMVFRVGVGAQVDCRLDPQSKDLCSGPVTVITGDDYIGACEAACDIWARSSCGQVLGMEPTMCWRRCRDAGTPSLFTTNGNEGWGWDYVNCIERAALNVGDGKCWMMTSVCRNVFDSGQPSQGVGPSSLATILGLSVGVFASLLIGLAIRGDLFRFMARLRGRNEGQSIEFSAVDNDPELD